MLAHRLEVPVGVQKDVAVLDAEVRDTPRRGVGQAPGAGASIEAPASRADEGYDAGLAPSTVTLLSTMPEARNAAMSAAPI